MKSRKSRSEPKLFLMTDVLDNYLKLRRICQAPFFIPFVQGVNGVNNIRKLCILSVEKSTYRDPGKTDLEDIFDEKMYAQTMRLYGMNDHNEYSFRNIILKSSCRSFPSTVRT